MRKAQTKQEADKLDLMSMRLDVKLTKEGKDVSAADKIIALDSYGLRPVEIARIVGKSTNYVNKELSVHRRRKKKSQKAGQVTGNDKQTNIQPYA